MANANRQAWLSIRAELNNHHLADTILLLGPKQSKIAPSKYWPLDGRKDPKSNSVVKYVAVKS